MSRLLIDTSGYAHFKRNSAEAVTAIQQASELLLPTIVLGELQFGFELGSRTKQNQQDLNTFLGSPRATIVDVTEQTSKFYANLAVYLRQQGKPIPSNDVWIAALAMQHGATLLTADKHFTFLPQILTNLISTKV